MIAWGITYVVHSSLLIAAVWMVCRFVRAASARETLWKIALVAPLLTATVQVVDVTPRTMRYDVAPGFSRAIAPAPHPALRYAQDHPLPAQRGEGQQTGVRDAAPVMWMVVAGLLLMRLSGGRVWFAYALRDRVDVLREQERLARLRGAMGCRVDIRLTESHAVGSPIAMGGWEIVVPRDSFARLTDEQKETILAHEIAHLLRRDPLWLLAGEMVKALLFIQPLNWVVQKKMKECAEFLCDDLAVLHTSNPRALAETLAELATTVAPAPRAVAAMAEGGSNLMARVTRVLTMADRERPMRLVTRVAIGATAVLALAAFGPGFTPAKATDRVDHSVDDEPYTMHLSNGVLTQTFQGPEGHYDVRLTAKHLKMPQDASWFRFTSRRGFLRVRQTTTNGPLREIEIKPGDGRELAIVYRVGGAVKPWSEEARLVVVSAFEAERTYQKAPLASAIEVTPRPRRAPRERKLQTWNATIGLTGTRDRIPTSLRIEAKGIQYDASTGEVFFTGGASLFVEETYGDERRTFTRNRDQMLWSGAFGKRETGAWLIGVLREQSKLPENVLEALAKP